MQHTFGGKYRIEEVIANGGCGTPPLLLTPRHPPPTSSFLHSRFSIPRHAHSGREGGRYQTPANSPPQQPHPTRIKDIQNPLWLSRYTLDYVVWKTWRFRCYDPRPPWSLARRPLQDVQQTFLSQDCPSHRRPAGKHFPLLPLPRRHPRYLSFFGRVDPPAPSWNV